MDGAAATDAAAAGDTADGATTDPTFVAPRSTRQACIAYFRNMFARQSECQRVEPLDVNINPFWMVQCPDVLFAPGSRFTVEGAFDCAERWRSFPCTEVARNGAPDCAMTGELGGGAMCIFDAQCTSGACAGAGVTPSCRTCLEGVALAGTCDELSQTCARRSVCTNGTCEPIPKLEPVASGEVCERDEQCPMLEEHCFHAPDGMLRCQLPPGEEQPCGTVGSFFVCAVGTGCAPDHVCRRLPSAGAPCLHSTGQPDLPSGALCAVDAYCTDNDSCADLPAIGKPCASSSDLNGRNCVAGARCDAGTCLALIAVGQPCPQSNDSDDQGDCVNGATCACTNSRCDPPGMCMRVMEEAGPCTATNVQCVNGTRCDNGTCVAVASQGLAEAAAQTCQAMSM